MKNLNITEVSCSDSEKFARILDSISFKDTIIDTEPYENFDYIKIQSNGESPYEEIISLSRQYPDLTFTVCYQFGKDDFNNCYRFYFTNGEIKEPETKIEYLINVDGVTSNHKGEKGVHFFQLLEKAISYFRRIDCLRITETGSISFDFAEEVTVVFEDEEYSMILLKYDYEISILSFNAREPEMVAQN